MPAIRSALRDDLDRADAFPERRTSANRPSEPGQDGLCAEPEREVRNDFVVGAPVRRVIRESRGEHLGQVDERLGGFGGQPDDSRELSGSLEAHIEWPNVPDQAGNPPPNGRRQLGAREARIEQCDVRRHPERRHWIVVLAQLLELRWQPDSHNESAPTAHGGLVYGRPLGGRRMTSSTGRLPAAVRDIGKVHHVALIVRSIDAALPLWRDMLHLELETVMDIPSDRVRIAFLAVGESKVELVEPTDDSTGVARFLESKGEGFHHVCFEVPNLAETLLRLEISGLELIDTSPRRGAEGPVAFIHPRSCHGVLVELIEAPGGPAWRSLGFPPAS